MSKGQAWQPGLPRLLVFLFQKAVAFHVNLIDCEHGMHTCSRVLVIFSMAKGVMKPSEPIAKGTKGGTEPLPRMEQVHSTVPSPPRVTTASKPSAT